MATTVESFSEIENKFFSYIQEIVYCTMITVDRKSRPRARVLLPIWEVVDGKPVGWLAAYKTPVKVAHLANNPHTTYSYWNPSQNAVFVDSVSTWAEDRETRQYAWDLYRKEAPPASGTTRSTSGAAAPRTPSTTSCASTPGGCRCSAVRTSAAASGPTRAAADP